MMLSPEQLSVLLPVIILVLISSLARTVHFELFERHFKLTFADAPLWSFLYFSVCAAFVAFLFPHEIGELFAGMTPVGYLALIFVMIIIFPALYRGTRGLSGTPQWLATLYPGQGMLTLEERYILAKIAD